MIAHTTCQYQKKSKRSSEEEHAEATNHPKYNNNNNITIEHSSENGSMLDKSVEDIEVDENMDEEKVLGKFLTSLMTVHK